MAYNRFLNVDALDYCGKEARDIMSQDVYSLDIRNYGITFLPNTKGKTKIHTGEISELLQTYSCPFTPQGNAVLGEWFVEPVALKANVEACYSDFWDNYLVESTEISLRGGIPDEFSNWYFAKFREEMKAEYQEIFWKGSTDYSGETKQYLSVTDGIEKQLEDNSGVTKINGAAFTVDNVLSQVEAAVVRAMNLSADGGFAFDKYKIFMNKNDVMMLKVALGKLCCGNSTSDKFSNYGKEGDKVFIYGLEVIPTEQSRYTVIVANPKNLVLAFDVFDSSTEYKLIDMRSTTGDNMFRVLAITNIGVGIVWPSTIVYSRVA